MKVGFVAFSCGSVLMGAGYVIGALLEEGCEVLFFNLNNMVGNNKVEQTLQDLKIRNAVNQLLECEVIFFSTLSVEFPQAIDIVRKLKQTKNIPVVFGGVHPTIVGLKLLEEYPEIDYICVGEGESMVREIVRETLGVNQIRNLGWRKCDGTAVLNPIREPEDLSKEINFPWHLYPRDFVVKGDGIIYVRATRGCPFSCTYCGNSAYLRIYGIGYLRKRPIDQVIKEMNYLKETHHPKMFSFADEMLIWDKEYSMALFKAIKQEIGLPFGFLTRAEYIDEDLVKCAAECGCTNVDMGIECGDETFRKTYLNRRTTNAQIISAFNILRDHGIKILSLNMIGYPFEGDEERTKSTVELNKLIRPDQVVFSIFHPFIGTKLYDYCIEHDLIDKEKEKRIRNVYDESILKGVTLHNKRIELDQMFNKVAEYQIEDTLRNAVIRKVRRMIS